MNILDVLSQTYDRFFSFGGLTAQILQRVAPGSPRIDCSPCDTVNIPTITRALNGGDITTEYYRYDLI